MGFNSAPADSDTTCSYAAFLAWSLKLSSVNNSDLGIIFLLLTKFSLAYPLTDNWVLTSLLTGIKRVKDNLVQQKLPISYCAFIALFILNLSFDASFWACLTALFGLFRKSNLSPSSDKQYDPKKQLSR